MTDNDKKYLSRLIAQGEGQHLDFKYHVAEAEKIAKSLVAFANSQGGILLIGVKDNGKVKGISTDEEVYMMEMASDSYCKPPVELIMNAKSYDDKTVLVVEIKESKNKPHFAKEAPDKWIAYVRYKDKNLLANKVWLDVLKRKNEGRRTKLSYTDNEARLLQLIREKETITQRESAKHLRLPHHKIHKMLVDLVSIGVLEHCIEPGKKYFKIANNRKK